MKAEKVQGGGQLLCEHIPEGSLSFERIYNLSEADFMVDPQAFNSLKEEPTIDFFLKYLRNRYWFLNHDYLGKQPNEQWHLRVGNMALEVYSYLNGPGQVTTEEVKHMGESIALFNAHFPLPAHAAPLTIAVIDKFRRKLGSNRSYSIIAEACRPARSFSLAASKGALSHEPWNPKIPLETRRADVFHELAHFSLDSELSEAWRDAGFSWRPVYTPVRHRHAVRDGYKLYKANQPGSCVTEYAKTAEPEDIAESVVAYLGLADRALNAKKRRILHDNDADLPPEAYEVIKRRHPTTPELPGNNLRYVVSRRLLPV
jgi:hypothetical protein